MTVLEKKAASGVDGRKLAQFLGVGLVAAAIGVGAAFGIGSITESDALSPSQISDIRSSELADHLETRYLAGVTATRNADLAEYHRRTFMARVAEIHEQRAEDMAEFRFGGAGAN